MGRKKSQDGHLVVGKRILAISRMVNEQNSIARFANPEMVRLVERTRLSATLSGVIDNRLICLESVESDTALRVTNAKGVISPLHAGAPGKVLLAFQTKSKRDRFFKTTPLTPFTPNTITDPEKLKKELALIREKGFAFSRSEMLEGAEGFSVPVFDGSKRIVAALSIAGPEHQINKMDKDALIDLVKKSAQEITRSLS